MNLLLDTHVWVWSQEQPEKLGPRARQALLDREHSNTICTISTLEIARLLTVGTLSLAIPLSTWIADSLRNLDATSVTVTHEIAAEAYTLPSAFHKDPADRILVATARIHQLILLTADERILKYPHVQAMDAQS
ncbi:MAG: type II toxin-antitoxin system VapC family toxin [Deltaproteobacteria bacterium]|nr:type II toxin-antitoxin system VapC family toxin [Deltaproteobacteria bacterium]